MKNKYLIRKSRIVRRVLGLSLPKALKLMKMIEGNELPLDIATMLEQSGVRVDKLVITGMCPDDGGDEGYYVLVTKRGEVVEDLLKFCCVGVYIEKKYIPEGY